LREIECRGVEGERSFRLRSQRNKQAIDHALEARELPLDLVAGFLVRTIEALGESVQITPRHG
jgi:hypothetical protein